MTEQHPVGGCERQRVAGRFLPGQMSRSRHQLARLDAAELREGSIGRFIAPDSLAWGEHRVSPVAFLVIPIVLVAVDHHLVAGFPTFDLVADRPDDS